MNRLLLVLALAALGWVLASNSPTLDSQAAAIAKAGSLSLQLRITEVGGGANAQTLAIATPDRLLWETPTNLTVCDGGFMYVLNKAKNTYTKAPVERDGLARRLGAEALWPWLTALDPAALKGVAAERRGASRKLGGVSVHEVLLDRGPDGTITLFVEPASGLVRGSTYKTAAGKEIIVQTTEAKLGKADPIAWTPPPGATLEVVPLVAKLKFADVKPIFDSNCIRCHNSQRVPGGLVFETYEGVLRGVSPGNPDSSRIVRALSSGHMPPDGPLPEPDVEKIAKWVADGANP